VRLYDFPLNSQWMTMKEGHVIFDSKIDKIVDKSNAAGLKDVQYKKLKLSLVVNARQIVFIATQPAFDSVSQIIKK
jgi:hypothetical protein